VVMTLHIAPVSASAEPEKVIDGRYVVSLALVSEQDAMRFRFSFRDVRTGQRLPGPIAYRVKIREGHTTTVLYESPELQTTAGTGEVRYRVPRDGFYETFLEFRHADVPGTVYRPDDWYVWIPASAGRPSGLPWTSIGAAALVLVSAWYWRHKIVRRETATR
jgi:hypothetical protein